MSVPTPILQYNLSDASVKGLLPSGYTPLAYVEFPGSGAGIDLGYKFNALTDSYEIEFLAVSNTGQNGMILASNGAKYSWLYYYNTAGIKIYITDSNGSLRNSGNGPNDLHKHIVRYHDRKWYIDRGDSSATGTYESYSFVQDTNNLCLGDYSTSQSYPFKGKIYRVKIWRNDALQRDLIPASHSSGNGYYDLITRTFYTRTGLIAGPELAIGKNGGKSLPEEYLLVEYLEGTGTLWINTGYLCNSSNVPTLKYKLDAMATNTAVGNRWWACGIGGGSGITFHVGIGNGSTSTFPFTHGTGVTDRQSGINGSLNTRYKWELDMNNSTYKVWSADGTILVNQTFTKATPTQSLNLALFRWYSYGGSGYIFGMKIYRVELYNGNTKVVDMFPVYRKSDGKPGMYDVIRNTFYTNAGSGEFILGPSITNCYTWEPNAGSGTLQGLYVNCNSIYDTNKGWCLSGNDSTYSYVEFPKEVINPLITAKTFTITFWFRVHNTNRHILFGSNSSYPLNIEYTPSGTKMRYYFTSSPDKIGSIAIATNTWYHVALCVTSTGFTAYVNGNVDATHTSAPAFNQFTGNCRIGSDSRDTQIYLGSDILNFMIFSTALTEAQVKELYGK